MLMLFRKKDESFYIDLQEGVDKNMTVGELFANGAIEVQVAQLKNNGVKIGIKAPDQLLVLRKELLSQSRDST